MNGQLFQVHAHPPRRGTEAQIVRFSFMFVISQPTLLSFGIVQGQWYACMSLQHCGGASLTHMAVWLPFSPLPRVVDALTVMARRLGRVARFV
jgi:hypothetical protein